MDDLKRCEGSDGKASVDFDSIHPAGRMLFAIEGMWCGSCARALEAAITKVPGVTQAGIHFATTSALIRWDPNRCDLHDVDRCVRKLGYRLASPLPPDEVSHRLEQEARTLLVRIAVAVFFGMWSMAAAIVLYIDGAVAAEPQRWWLGFASGLLALPALFYSGLPLYRAGWRTAKVGAPGLDTITTVGVVGSVLLSGWHLASGSSEVYFDTATMLVTLLLIGRLIEITARRRALAAIRALESVIPETAKRQSGTGETELVPADQLIRGDKIIVDAGSVFAADGLVVEGFSSADRSALTGEARPIPLAPGDKVEGGTLNLARQITVVVSKTIGEREIDRIGGHVACAIAGRGETQRLADSAASALSLAIPAIAVAAALTTVLGGSSLSEAMLRALSTIVIACPCALGIATPTAFVAAASRAASKGLLLREPAAFERLAAARTIIFDKTGTLTVGRPQIVSVETVGDWDEQTVLSLAASAEAGINHPIAHALVAGARLHPGAAKGHRDGRRATVLDPAGHRVVVEAEPLLSNDPTTVLRVTLNDQTIGRIRLSDEPRSDACEAIRALRARGLKIMLATGDAEGAARHIGALIGIEPNEIRAGCTPEEKLVLVQEAQGSVVFVGDGVNDGPALAAADCGIAVADAHAGASSLAAVVITRAGVGSVVTAVDLARRTSRVMLQNVSLSVVYNVAALGLAAIGAVPPVAAALAMLLSSISVLMNSLQLAK